MTQLDCITSFIDSLGDRRVVVLHRVLSQLQRVQTTDGLIPSGPVKHDIVDVVAPFKRKNKKKGHEVSVIITPEHN